MTVRKGVVLAAGEGTRLRPLTYNRPKPMLPAVHRPILEHVLDALIDAGISELHLVVGYKQGRVQNYFGPEYRGRPINYIRQKKQLGSGHALLQAKDQLSGEFLVVNGDRVIDRDIVSDVIDKFTQTTQPPVATLGVLPHSTISQYGAVKMKSGEITDLIEKPPNDDYQLLNAGVYAFSDEIFTSIEDTPWTSGELALTDTLRKLVGSDEPVYGSKTSGLWIDATYPWDLLDVTHELLCDDHINLPEFTDSVWIAETANVHESAVLQPPVVVGPDCEVQPGAVIGPRAALGQNVTVGANAVVQDSVIDRDTRIGPAVTLADCVTGQDVHIGAGSTVPGGPGDVHVNDRIFKKERLGGLLADRVHVGSNVNLAPGTLVGPQARLDSGVAVAGTIDEDTEVVR